MANVPEKTQKKRWVHKDCDIFLWYSLLSTIAAKDQLKNPNKYIILYFLCLQA